MHDPRSSYQVTTLWNAERRGFISSTPSFPKLEGKGKTMEEARAALISAIEKHVDEETVKQLSTDNATLEAKAATDRAGKAIVKKDEGTAP